MKALICVVISLASFELACGQSTIYAASSFQDSTVVTRIPVDVKPGTKKINCLFRGALSTGSLDITFRDPEKRTMAGFSLDASDGEKSSDAKGGARQEFNSPYAGKWELIIKLKDATGDVNYQIELKP